ncbi:hypothetical protein KR093_010036 [Drosophila rubida]|uniref:Uncharacterized protein n=1 Tax=Drosophila rubida TaxID=30044 RepID=A0AAD4PQP8_9MUSC|nr:hypothetical protein KR093_010036 [Drosophila rubida]
MWLSVPKLSEMCWEAFTYYNDVGRTDHKALLATGVPHKFINRLPPRRATTIELEKQMQKEQEKREKEKEKKKEKERKEKEKKERKEQKKEKLKEEKEQKEKDENEEYDEDYEPSTSTKRARF